MPKVAEDASQLYSAAADNLLVLCEEVTRATPEGARRFIEPAPGVLSRTKSKQHNIIFGRRGSGKSTLLRKIAADLTVDRRPIAFVDMETFKGHSYPDVLISVLIKSLREFEGWLAEAAITPATKTSFWQRLFGTTPNRPAFDRKRTAKVVTNLRALIDKLEIQLATPEVSDKKVTEYRERERASQVGGGAEVGNGAVKLTGSGKDEDRLKRSAEVQTQYVSHKVEYLHQNILKFQAFFAELAAVSDGPAFLILDDLYHIKKSDQAKVIDYFHRIAKGNGLWLKIGTIKHRSQWYQHSDPPVGMKLGDDAKEINLDISLEKFETLREFLRSILSGLMQEAPPLNARDLINPTAIDRLIIASGGVTRDFIGIFSGAILQARNRGAKHHRGPCRGCESSNRGIRSDKAGGVQTRYRCRQR